jgi:alpha-mannosidase
MGLFALGVLSGRATAADTGAAPTDLSREPTFYVAAYSHLDTQYRWTYPQVINEYLPRTLRDNFLLFEKHTNYIFNFTGANRYRMLKEYYPADYAKLKQYIAAGRWCPCGSEMEECDVNLPGAESIFRQILYGNNFFRREFGQAAVDLMLPDCFGFPASLPDIMAHAGLKGFSTAKLTMHGGAAAGGNGSPENTPNGIPFNVGVWEGLDGGSVLAVLHADGYASRFNGNLNNDTVWLNRINLNGRAGGVFADFRYYGSGDTGGAPRESNVQLVEEAAAAKGPLHVVVAQGDQIFRDILAMKPDPLPRLPHYQGDLELVEHSAGSLTSEAYQKRWNRQNELLADAAESVSVAADWLGTRPYPLARLNGAWTLVMSGQFHDLLPGTAIPEAFEFAWNDDVLAMNQFADVMTSGVEGVASRLNTRTDGAVIVVYNPLNIEREDVVKADVDFPAGNPRAVRVFGPDGKEVPAQLSGANQVLFLAKVPSVGLAVFDVRPADAASPAATLKVTESSLENARYRVRLDANGDVAGIFDKAANHELLAAPARLAIKHDFPRDWPAWNMDWTDQTNQPRAYVQGTSKFRITENGPACVAVEVTRETEASKFVQTIRLAAGDAGNRVEFDNAIDWRITNANLKATFPLTAANPRATYNLDVGTIQRGNDTPNQFEVVSHQWIDLTDQSAGYGVTLLTDCKYGSDKPDDHTLRLTLLRTPGVRNSHPDQGTQDFGHHEFSYGLAGHPGDWRAGQTDWQAQRLNQPLIAFASSKHDGPLGRSFSLLQLDNRRVRVLALKRAEDGDEVIVRLVELDGKPQQAVHLSFAGPVAGAREVNGQEQPVGAATVAAGALVADFKPYQLHTFAVKFAPANSKTSPPRSVPVALPYDRNVASLTGEKSESGFDGAGRCLPAEMLPREIDYNGIRFELAPMTGGQPNAVTARGQKIPLPGGNFQRVQLLAAAANGDQSATFRVDDAAQELTIEDWGGFIGSWDNRIWRLNARAGNPPRRDASINMHAMSEYEGLTAGFIKRAPVAWFASHHHPAAGVNEPYAYSYLFAYALDLPPNAKTLTLPENSNIRILAVTLAEAGSQVRPARPLYDTLQNSRAEAKAPAIGPQ